MVVLLDRNDLNHNRSDKPGQIPLLGAADNGHYGVVKILLGREDLIPDTLGTGG